MATPRTRTSNAPVELRASVLDAALNLGIRNSVMAKWMFDPIQEAEDGDELSSNPGLTSPSLSESTASPLTTDDSPMAPFNFRFPGRFAAPHPDSKLEKIYEQPLATVAEDRAPEAISVDHSMFVRASQSTEDGHSVTSSTRERRNKLRKEQKFGYESDGGYISESGKKSKKGTKKKDKGAGNESDGGYLSEAVSTKKPTKAKSKSKKAPKDSEEMSPVSDPGALLAAVNATLRVPIAQPDGYATDSTTSKRGRTKTKKDKGNRSRPTSPVPPMPGTEALTTPDTPSKRNRLLRMMTRSASRDRDKDKSKQANEIAPPPVPPLPMVLPIAEKFARSGTFVVSNTVSPSSSGSSAGTSSVTPDVSRTSSAGYVSSPDDGTKSLPSPVPVGTSTLDSELWNSDVLIAGGTKRVSHPDEAPITKRSAEGDLLAQTKAPDQERDIPIERARSPVHFRSLSPVFSAPINALLSTPEKRRKKKQNTSSPGGSVSSAESMNSSNSAGSSRVQPKLSTLAISQPNPHLSQRLRPPLSPLEIATTLKMRSDSPAQLGLLQPSTQLSPGYVQMGIPSPSVSTHRTPDSYVFVDREDEPQAELPPARALKERQSTFSVVPSSDYLVPSPLPSPGPSGLAGRRALNVAPLSSTRPLNATPRGSRSNTPIPGSPNEAFDGGLSLSIPNTPTARASVIAYYQIPPPSPPPTGPLPRVPDIERTPRRGSDDRQFLSPAVARYGSRSPSPLRNSPSRPTSPSGLFGQAIPSVRRGRESPFPTRPILPAEDRGALVRRPSTAYKSIRPDAPLGVTRAVSPDLLETRKQRYKSNYASLLQDEYADGDGLQNDVYSSSEDFHEDTRSSTYIRQARARGEKRVYFSDQTTSTSEEDFDVHMAVNALRRNNLSVEEEEDDDDRSRYTMDNSHEDDGSFDRRSAASMSVYSRYSMLDPDRSAELREGFVKRVADLYGKDGWDDIPAVPEVPASLRVTGPKMGIRNASSPSRF